MTQLPWIIAHRGASGYYPENTLPSFLGAVELGATCVEMDIQPTADKKLVVFHDKTMERIVGVPKKITDLLWQEVIQYDVGRWKAPKWEGTKIPLFKEVLEKLPRSMKLNLELKYYSPKDDWFEGSVLEVALEYDLPSRGYLAIKHVETISFVKKRAPDCPLGLLQKGRTPKEIFDLCCKWDLPFVQIRRTALTSEWVDRFHEQGIRVNFFYSDDPEEMKHLLKDLKIDGILTNYPDRAVQVFQELGLPLTKYKDFS
ncbi:glycerophosphodiester phosphodiesterase [Candidatus Borrarchaeum sp.]|uniref:glycerophosphodiester phosphodiesterase n=1 Tax=Candidatus Borrarchaeum sp. TaxID=2846742 RepID=UPI00257BDE0C|nr:glycerophosphodiester phosphodiesterase [Candidatus Borrarchaeum sp.]